MRLIKISDLRKKIKRLRSKPGKWKGGRRGKLRVSREGSYDIHTHNEAKLLDFS